MIDPFGADNVTLSPVSSPATVKDSGLPVSVIANAPVPALLEFRTTVPLLAVSKILMPVPVAVNVVAFVADTDADAEPPLTVRAAVLIG